MGFCHIVLAKSVNFCYVTIDLIVALQHKKVSQLVHQEMLLIDCELTSFKALKALMRIFIQKFVGLSIILIEVQDVFTLNFYRLGIKFCIKMSQLVTELSIYKFDPIHLL